MKINEMIKKIDSFPSYLISGEDLRKLGFMDKSFSINNITERNMNNLLYYRFGKATRRFLKQDVIDFIHKNLNGYKLSDEYGFNKLFTRTIKESLTQKDECTDEDEVPLSNDSFITILSSIQQIADRQSRYISELVNSILKL